MLPRRRPSSAPLAPQRISSSAGGSLTMVSSTSEDAAASRGEPATFAPCRARSSVLARVRFHTVSGNPAFSRFAPIGLPIKPSPINPTAGFTRNLPERIAIGENRRANITLFGDKTKRLFRRDIRRRREGRPGTGTQMGPYWPKPFVSRDLRHGLNRALRNKTRQNL